MLSDLSPSPSPFPLLQSCYSVATVLLQSCCRVATKLLLSCYSFATEVATVLLQSCYSVATKLLQSCYKVATVLLQCCYHVTTVSTVSTMSTILQVCYKVACSFTTRLLPKALQALQHCRDSLCNTGFADESNLVAIKYIHTSNIWCGCQCRGCS